jgi:3-phosphoshikimate 1-carboxyvinyltransferase
MNALGAHWRVEGSSWIFEGTSGHLHEPEVILDLGNSGTAMRLLTGALACQPFLTVLTGDESLRGRPMERVADPLRKMGATILTRLGGRAPLAVYGKRLSPITYHLPMASAQVKSALLLAGLGAGPGTLRLQEPGPARDHTERFFQYLGVPLEVAGPRISLKTPARLESFDITVPGDPSAAAFFVAAATLTPGSELTLTDVNLNPRRLGFMRVLKMMGASVVVEPEGPQDPEPRGRIMVRHSPLGGVKVPAEDVATLIDEVPVLAVAAAFAFGDTIFEGLGELKHKESDRLASTADLINSLGGSARVDGDTLHVVGGEGPGCLRGGRVGSRGDHRIAMAALVAGCAAAGPVEVHGAQWIATSDPTFLSTLQKLR